MKYENINLEAFKEIWMSDDRAFLQTFIDESEFMKVNYKFCYENFIPRLTSLEVDGDGIAAFKIDTKVHTPDGMADFKAPLGRNTGVNFKGSAGYTGSVATFGKALQPVDALEDRSWRKLEQQFGSASRIIMDWLPKVQTLRNYMDSRLSNMAGQLLSSGMILGDGDGNNAVMYLQDARVPEANKVKAGAKVWEDSDCDILDQMHKIELDYRERTGDLQPLEWMIKLDMWKNIFMTNSKLKASIIEWRKIKELPTSSGGTVLEEWIVSYINSIGITSPIRIAKEGEVSIDSINGGFQDLRKDVQGWDSKIAILKPRGYSGEIIKGEILRATLLDDANSKTVRNMVAYAEGGLFALITSVVEDNNGLSTLHTDMEGCCAPALSIAPYLTLVDTSEVS